MQKYQAEVLLRRAVGDPNVRFRTGQWEAIDALVNHRRNVDGGTAHWLGQKLGLLHWYAHIA